MNNYSFLRPWFHSVSLNNSYESILAYFEGEQLRESIENDLKRGLSNTTRSRFYGCIFIYWLSLAAKELYSNLGRTSKGKEKKSFRLLWGNTLLTALHLPHLFGSSGSTNATNDLDVAAKWWRSFQATSFHIFSVSYKWNGDRYFNFLPVVIVVVGLFTPT